MWNWQSKEWPNFKWDSEKLSRAENLFIEGAGVIAGASRHMLSGDQQLLSVELISTEALDTSEIEGEYLNRHSVQSSIRRELGLKTVCGVRGVVKAVTSLPLVNGRFTNAKALRKSSCAVGAYRNLGSYGRRGACVLCRAIFMKRLPGGLLK